MFVVDFRTEGFSGPCARCKNKYLPRFVLTDLGTSKVDNGLCEYIDGQIEQPDPDCQGCTFLKAEARVIANPP
jgi:hypothetical protein